MHRPYERMPLNSLSFSFLTSLAHDGAAGRAQLQRYCEAADLPVTEVLTEMRSSPDILAMALVGDLDHDHYPKTMQLVRDFRTQDDYGDVIASKMQLGVAQMRDLGNLYSASLPAWMAAGLEEACEAKVDLGGHEVLAVGYGSGDAAEAIPMRAVAGWSDAAARIGFAAALQPAVELDREHYLALHGKSRTNLGFRARDEFVIDRVGNRNTPGYSDEGIEYYRYVNGA
jgi:hydroxymethylglutaryl-CoA synthase